MSREIMSVSYNPMPYKALCEIYSHGWECAFLHKDGAHFTQACLWMHCKDFLNDALWGKYNNKCGSIYGFSYTPGKDPPIDDDKTRILVRNTDDSADLFGRKCVRSLRLVRAVEKLMGFTQSRLRHAVPKGDPQKKTAEYYFEGDARWMLSSPLISLYTCLLRMGGWYEGKDPIAFIEKKLSHSNDWGYLAPSVSNGGLRALLTHNVKLFSPNHRENYEVGCIGTMHNLGVQTWATQYFGKKHTSAPGKYWRSDVTGNK